MEESSTPSVTTRSVGMRYGIILAVISIVFFLILTFAGVDQTKGAGRWFGMVFYLVVIFLAQKNFKDEGDDFMTYGQGMGISFWIAVISTVIYSFFFYVYIKFIDASFVENVKNKAIEDMQAKGMGDAEIDQAMSFAGKFMSPEAMLIFGLIFGVIIIVICGLIVTIFTQKTNPNAEL